MTELESLLVLVNTPGIGAVRIRLLMEHFGSARAVLTADDRKVRELPGFGEKLCAAVAGWNSSSAWKADLERVEKMGAALISYADPDFPKSLLALADHPVLLYVVGQLQPSDANSIAVIGTRSASIYGTEMAGRISEDLARQGLTVVSGLARGVDTAAHTGALKAGRTLAVIGSGLANLYPQENAPLAKAITQSGAVISEFPMATPPDRQNFPMRNRIVAGLSKGALLIESPAKGGAMITMERAYNEGKMCFALPGRADSEGFRGNHRLIKEQKAELVENAGDILSHFGELFPTAVETPPRVVQSLEKEEQVVFDLLSAEEQSIEWIAQRAGLPASKLNVLLMSLTLKRVIKEFPGKIYKRAC
jgi:DNA processing protein